MKIKNQLLSLLTFLTLISISACGNLNKNNDLNLIKVGLQCGPEYVVAQVA